MKEIISLFFPAYRAIASLLKDPIFCRHEMKYWDMKWIVDYEPGFFYCISSHWLSTFRT